MCERERRCNKETRLVLKLHLRLRITSRPQRAAGVSFYLPGREQKASALCVCGRPCGSAAAPVTSTCPRWLFQVILSSHLILEIHFPSCSLKTTKVCLKEIIRPHPSGPTALTGKSDSAELAPSPPASFFGHFQIFSVSYRAGNSFRNAEKTSPRVIVALVVFPERLER